MFSKNIYLKKAKKTGNIIIQTLLGPNSKRLYNFCNGFVYLIIMNIFIELLKGLNIIHFNRIIYNNIKQNNIAWNCFYGGRSSSKISLIDFNLSLDLESNI